MNSRQSTSRAGYRKNGLQASCETCRKRKTKCDHKRPVCTYCDTHRLQCFYHPAPMSKPRSKPPSAQSSPVSQPLQPLQNTPPVVSPPSVSNPNQVASSSIFQMLSTAEPGIPIPKTFVSQLHEQRTEARQLERIKEVLGSLRYLSQIKECIQSLVAIATSGHVPRFLVKELLDKLPVVENQGKVEYAGGIDQLASNILAASTSIVRVPADADMHTFCDLFTGPNLRIETLGLLTKLTATILLFHRTAVQSPDPEFASEMLYCGTLGLELARTLAPEPNDVLIWLGFTNMCMADYLEGSTSVYLWHQMSDLSIDMLSLNVHKESSHAIDKLPFFLSEIRKRIFATTNHFDKIRAVELNRQPCIRLQYADCAPPLDIPEEDLMSAAVLSNNQNLLTETGWSRAGKLGVNSAARVRYMLAHFEEELIDTRASSDSGREAKLRQLSARLSTAWNELPPYVKYAPDCWSSTRPWDCLMLAILYLDYNNFQFSLLSLLKSSTYIPAELITTSWEMLEVVLRVSKEQNRGHLSTEDLPTMLLCQGVPSASLLLNALQGPSPIQLPHGVHRAAIIQKVSVLISQLDIAATKTESNHFFCERAAKFVSDRLNAVLDPPASTPGPSDTYPHMLDTATDASSSGQDGWFDMPNNLFAGYPFMAEQGWTNWSLLNIDPYTVSELNER